MSKSSAPAEPAVMPRLPAASIDFNALHDADAKGITGDALIAAALVSVEEAPPAPPAVPPAPAPAAPDKA